MQTMIGHFTSIYPIASLNSAQASTLRLTAFNFSREG
jgi:hypothetical protein